MTTIPAVNIGKHRWSKGIFVVSELSFGVKVSSKNIEIGKEHTDYVWLSFKEAIKLLKYDSNKTALWELNYRLTKKEKSGINETHFGCHYIDINKYCNSENTFLGDGKN